MPYKLAIRLIHTTPTERTHLVVPVVTAEGEEGMVVMTMEEAVDEVKNKNRRDGNMGPKHYTIQVTLLIPKIHVWVNIVLAVVLMIC